jgi:putative transposase
MVDITCITRLGGAREHVILVIDVFSRRSLAASLRDGEPSGEDVTQLLEDAIARYGKPKHMVTDQGPQLTSEEFSDTLERHGINRRLGAVGQHGSIAVIERTILTLKGAMRRLIAPELTRQDLAERLTLALHWYSTLRPHTTLGCATPSEIYFGTPALATQAVRAPRVGEAHTTLQIEIRYLDPGGLHLPYLERIAA